jgi:hypothetical protein
VTGPEELTGEEPCLLDRRKTVVAGSKSLIDVAHRGPVGQVLTTGGAFENCVSTDKANRADRAPARAEPAEAPDFRSGQLSPQTIIDDDGHSVSGFGGDDGVRDDHHFAQILALADTFGHG